MGKSCGHLVPCKLVCYLNYYLLLFLPVASAQDGGASYVPVLVCSCQFMQAPKDKLSANECAALLHRLCCSCCTLLLQCVRCSGVQDGTNGHRCHCRKKSFPAIPDARLLLQSDPPVAFDGQAAASLTDCCCTWRLVCRVKYVGPLGQLFNLQAVAGFELFRLSTSFDEFWSVLQLVKQSHPDVVP